jgi:hypothetical protein
MVLTGSVCCFGAVIETEMDANAHQWNFVPLHDGIETIPSIRGSFPPSLKDFTLKFHRLDDKPCTATLSWTAPSLQADAFYNLKHRI